LVISQALQFLALWAAKLLFFSGSCSETEVSEQLYYRRGFPKTSVFGKAPLNLAEKTGLWPFFSIALPQTNRVLEKAQNLNINPLFCLAALSTPSPSERVIAPANRL
jgi:hypothetical protein